MNNSNPMNKADDYSADYLNASTVLDENGKVVFRIGVDAPETAPQWWKDISIRFCGEESPYFVEAEITKRETCGGSGMETFWRESGGKYMPCPDCAGRDLMDSSDPMDGSN